MNHLKNEEEAASQRQQYEEAAKLRAEFLRQEDEYNKAKNKWLKKEKISGEVTEEQIAQLISNWTGIPVSQMLEGESEKLLHMEERIHERLINQEEAVQGNF